MKLLSKEELKGIDSTQSTIKKWDELFRTAIPNLGYKQDVVDNMYPYAAGIPMKDGSTLPVMDTGRVFYRLSWADKLAGMLSVFVSGYDSDWPATTNIYYTVVGLAASNSDTFLKMFPDETVETYNDLYRELGNPDCTCTVPNVRLTLNSETAKRLWRKFVEESDVYVDGSANSLVSAQHASGLVSENYKELLASLSTNYFVDCGTHRSDSGYVLYIFNRNLENIYGEFPKDIMRRLVNHICTGAYSKLLAYDEVYLQEYLVVSMNPIDKFMCSTKQAFQSCMSISKQNDITGTSSVHAFGLPALFPSESVYLVFTTPGKHKNMYWETEELQKEPEQRDKEKAYKYLKMTCRALTYKGTLTTKTKDFVNRILPEKIWGNVDRDLARAEECDKASLLTACQEIKADQPRLFIGRQYAAKGEDRVWTVLAEIMLARQGVSTSYAYTEETNSILDWLRSPNRDRFLPRSWVAEELYKGNRNYFTRIGALCDRKAITYDRFGYIRGIYYDNISWSFKDNARNISPKYPSFAIPDDGSPVRSDVDHVIQVGCIRYGSNSVTQAHAKAGLDMFLMMSGKQNYTFFNQDVKLCDHCGKTIEGIASKLSDGRYICPDCCETLEIKKCEACGDLYLPDQAHLHELHNVRELTNPKNYQEIPPKFLCVSQLKKLSVNSPEGTIYYLCAHCGSIVSKYDSTFYHSLNTTLSCEFKGFLIRIRLCSECLSKAVMCDKCKRIIFLDTIADACLLLPNRRVICPDCIDSIRMKQEKRKSLKALFVEAVEKDFQPEPAEDITEADRIARVSEDNDRTVGKIETLVKDVRKQISTYLQVHPEESFPVIKASNTPLQEGSTEVEDTEPASEMLV